ncbi:MAG: magnesium transporter [Mucilaginibacter polytrichastri]|nr:magnesium transporter [Mucilaginibacter polytrichastri]
MSSFEPDKTDVRRLRDALEGDDERLPILLDDYHASEIALLFDQLDGGERERIINILDVEKASAVLSEMDEEAHPEELLFQLEPEKRAEIIEELDYDDATDIIAQLDTDEQRQILETLDEEDASNIRELLTYSEDSAGGLMNTGIIKVNINLRKKEAMDEIIRQSEDLDDFYIYVVDDSDMLKGLISLKEILKARWDKPVSSMVNEDFVYVSEDTDQEEVARLISQYNLTSIPVVDRRMKLLGRITVDDILDVVEEENTEDMLKFSGVSENEELSGGWRDAIRSRLPWLIINLGTAFLASAIIRSFGATLDRLIILGSYMTVIAGMGGNSATQALAVTIRRISLSSLSDKQTYNTVLKELLVGLTNGAVIGLVVFLVACFYDHNVRLGVVLLLAMAGNLLIAGFTGSAIPMLLKRIGVDPAVASSIIITTFTDCFGFLLLLGLASKLLLS